MADTYLVQTAFTHSSGLPEDVVVNTMHCLADADSDAIAFAARVKTFYDTFHSPGTDPIVNFLGDSLSGAVTQKVYNLADAIPRTPISTTTWTFTPITTVGDLPGEVALVLSYRLSSPLGGVPLASQRNRIYVGPLNLLAISGAGVGDTAWPPPARPSTAVLNALKGAALYLEGSNTASGKWAVYSATAALTGSGLVGFIDNAFDTQRRRGVAATGRTTW